MKPSQGYYSIIQYCPDLMRLEGANVGVVLFCPELGRIQARTAKGNQRIRRFFGSEDDDWAQINAVKFSIEQRLKVEGERFQSLADLEQFIATRGNEIRLTPARSIRVVDFDTELQRLFDRLVGGRARREEARAVRNTLELAFAQAGVDHYLEKKVSVPLAAWHQRVKAPYGFQNGRFNLIKPAPFQGLKPSNVLNRVSRYAVEGDLLYEHPDAKRGDLKLIVVGQFGPDQQEEQSAAEEVFRKNHTELYTSEDLDRLIRLIKTTGKQPAV